MKFRIEGAKFQDALRKVSGVSSAKNTLRILANVRIQAADGRIALTATNLDVVLAAEVDCAEIEEHGATTVPMGRLEQAVSVLPPGIVEVDVSYSDVMTLKSGSTRMAIGGIADKEFPSTPTIGNGGVSCSIPAKALTDILRRTSYSMSRDTTRRSLCGVLLDFPGDGTICAVATDGRRLAKASVSSDGLLEKRQFVIPSATIPLIMRLRDAEGDATVESDGGIMRISVDSGRRSIFTKLTADQFPNYSQVIPSSHETEASVDRFALSTAISRVLVMASSDTPTVKMTFADNAIVLDVEGDDYCKAHEEIPIKYDGKSISLAMNPHYVLDILKNVDADNLAFDLTNESSPISVRIPGENFLGVVMPLRKN